MACQASSLHLSDRSHGVVLASSRDPLGLNFESSFFFLAFDRLVALDDDLVLRVGAIAASLLLLLPLLLVVITVSSSKVYFEFPINSRSLLSFILNKNKPYYWSNL